MKNKLIALVVLVIINVFAWGYASSFWGSGYNEDAIEITGNAVLKGYDTDLGSSDAITFYPTPTMTDEEIMMKMADRILELEERLDNPPPMESGNRYAWWI